MIHPATPHPLVCHAFSSKSFYHVSPELKAQSFSFSLQE